MSESDSLNNVHETLAKRAKERAKDRQRITELETQVQELIGRVQELEARVPEPGDQEYDHMDKSDKATVVRDKLYKEAIATGGKAAVDYKDVIRMFDGNPSPAHAYDLMEKAANVDGYDYGKSRAGKKRLTVDADRVERE